ncbi:MAG TPA: ABC transporter ATP-binding protein [Chloroflexi bacterium]|nr:ABC transporter ATP-binding protein [Chloroflexota bacterium]HHW89238.1 ABC transporter ATP-binding protein [Chloroflexota bacterium]
MVDKSTKSASAPPKAATEVVLQAVNLTKRYGAAVAVDNLNLTLTRGEVFGLLGPNGAGKTTTILMLLGLTEPTAGTVRVLGLDPARDPLAVKARVGYLPDSVGFYDELSARENLSYIARLNGLARTAAQQRIRAAIDRMGLSEVIDRPVGTFSRGMRQRLGVAELLLKEPEIIIMDEPTLGLDPEAAQGFLKLIRELKHEGITILLSSHLLHQVQAVCDRVGLFSHGRMMISGAVAELAQRILGGGYRILIEASGDPRAIQSALLALPGVKKVEAAERDHFVIVGDRDLRADAASAIVGVGGSLIGLDVEAPSLDEIYATYFKEATNGAIA